MRQGRMGVAVLGAAFAMAVGPVSAHAQQAKSIGKVEFETNCAICHGTTGKGDGQLADFLAKRPADLTTISKRYNGSFPFNVVYEIIDGRQEIGGHGTREMPIWGSAYSQEGWAKMYGLESSEAAESYVRGKIVALIGYIQSIQNQ